MGSPLIVVSHLVDAYLAVVRKMEVYVQDGRCHSYSLKSESPFHDEDAISVELNDLHLSKAMEFSLDEVGLLLTGCFYILVN